ncbi:hypothetical protein FOXB_14453, partial [Fusarium oxysporum f. sp. conglutinans Fo5176]
YHVFLDNLFSSPNLFRRLRQLGHGATGTARQNCGFHEPLVKLKKVDNTAAADLEFNYLTAVPTKDNLVNQTIWKDNALVLFLSTVFTGVERVDRKRKRPTTDQPSARPIKRFFGAEPVKVISIPSIAAIYNSDRNGLVWSGMGGQTKAIDRGAASLRVPHFLRFSLVQIPPVSAPLRARILPHSCTARSSNPYIRLLAR